MGEGTTTPPPHARNLRLGAMDGAIHLASPGAGIRPCSVAVALDQAGVDQCLPSGGGFINC